MKKIVTFLFLTCCFFSFSQNKYEAYYQKCTTEKNSIQKIDMLCKLAIYYSDTIRATSYLNEAQGIAKRQKNAELTALIKIKKAFVFNKNNLKKKAIIFKNEVIEELPNLRNSRSVAEVYYFLGILEKDDGKALNYHFKGLEIADKTGDFTLASKFCYIISGTYGVLLKTDLMKKYSFLAVGYSKKAKSFDARIYADLALGSYYLDVYEGTKNKAYQDSIITLYSKTIDFINKNKPEYLFVKHTADVFINLANSYSTDIHHNKEKFLAALEDGEKYGSELNNRPATNSAIGLRGEYFYVQKDYASAIKNFNKGLDLAIAFADNRLAEKFCNSLANCYESLNDFENYKKYKSLQIDYSKKHFNEETAKEVVLAEEQFENEKKQLQIGILEKENQFKTALFWIFLSSLFILSIAIFFRFRYFRAKENLLNEKQLASELLSKIKEKEIEQTLYEKEITEQQKNQLQNQLSSSLLQLNDKNNLLTDVKRISDNKTISRIINENLNSDENYELYRMQVGDMHPNFTSHLQLKANNTLTNLDIKYCIYFFLGLETKEIANKLNVAPKSVRMTRYRIKQKLRLTESDDLYRFLKTIN